MELATFSISVAQQNWLCSKNLTTSTFHFYKYPQRTSFLKFHSLVPRPFSNGVICRGSSFGFIDNITSNSNYNNNLNNKIYKRVDSCLIIPPSGNKRPRAIIKFLGGAFIGAVPEVTYRYPFLSFPFLHQYKVLFWFWVWVFLVTWLSFWQRKDF